MIRVLSVLFTSVSIASAAIVVSDDASFRAALSGAKPGDEIVVKEGEYRGGIQVRDRSGTEDRPITLRAQGRVMLRGGGSTAIQFSACSHWTIRGLQAEGFTGNGFNFDDAGRLDQPVVGLVLEELRVYETGPKGNHDGIKMSGITKFRVANCIIEGWGGSAIDMVGCRDGVVAACRLRGLEGFSSASGIQMKGGTRGIHVRSCRFDRAGQRAINLGGSTGKPYFRPEVTRFEAEGIEVSNCLFLGGETAVAFVTSSGGRVHHNLILRPEKWAFRILQEQPVAEFGRCEKGEVFRNVIVFPESNRTAVNVGPDTLPGTFTFRENAWFHEGGRHRPQLPVEEAGGLYGVDPELVETKIRSRELFGYGPRN
ncbi:chondroitinase B [Haloferula helveola]|uniref:Chondroitinase B n=1 Tax=Haloferula helveola TaxID=490095 RepID=A0ABN6H8Q0_9BACT|nr:chondroitinase B [Haloferula helveola]